MQDGYWVSFDRMHWWNGSGWILGQPPVRPGTSAPLGTGGPAAVVAAIVGVIGFVLFAIFAMGVCQSMPQPGMIGP